MARRRRLTAPSKDELERLEQEFRSETPVSRGGLSRAPIGQVAADTASFLEADSAEARAALARDKADAQRLRDADGRGLLLLDLPLDAINSDAIIRDRIEVRPEELAELKASVREHGLRLPIEVFENPDDKSGARYGLLTGYRRYRALEELLRETGEVRFSTVRAILRDPTALGGAFAAMVEENEIRSEISHFERGRIAVLACHQGAFESVDAAVSALFGSGSKAKRSKVRSFALIYEHLGDRLAHPEYLRERDGLVISSALRSGAIDQLRAVVGAGTHPTPEAEVKALLHAAKSVLSEPDLRRGGRPRAKVPVEAKHPGIAVRQTAKKWVMEFDKESVSEAELKGLVALIEQRLKQ